MRCCTEIFSSRCMTTRCLFSPLPHWHCAVCGSPKKEFFASPSGISSSRKICGCFWPSPLPSVFCGIYPYFHFYRRRARELFAFVVAGRGGQSLDYESNTSIDDHDV